MTVPSTPPRPPASPKFQLPPTTVSPQATRLDRVLDLVTSHEANLAENELKVLDLTKRVAQAEDASRGRRDEDRRARAAEDAALRAELASVKDAVKRVEGAIALWSGDTDGIKHEVRELVSKCRDASNAELSETKLGFKAVLQDVVDKVAAQLDAVRRDAVATRHNYANADEVAALHEKIDAFEVAERMREAHHRETMNGMLDAMEKMKRRTQKLVGFYNEHAEGRRAGRSEAEPANHASSNASSETDEKLSRLLKENATLQFLDLSSNTIGRGNGIGPVHLEASEGTQAIAEGLRDNTTLRSLQLSGNPIGDKGVVMVIEAVGINLSVRDLGLVFDWDLRQAAGRLGLGGRKDEV